MKAVAILSLASVAFAAPAADLDKRQMMVMSATDLTKGSCKDVTFIWVRGTTELGNLGEFVGGRLVPELKKVFPSLAVEGVAYGAGVPGNLMPGGGDPAGIKEATKDYNLAVSKCPNTVLIGGGYSQGAAITHRSVEALPANVKERIAGITLYGDTQFYQDKGQIKNFPKDKVKTFCNGYQELKSYSSDGVCNGLLVVNYGHMSYGDSMKPGATWLKAQVDAFKSSKESSTKEESEPEEKPTKKAAKPKGTKQTFQIAAAFDGAVGVAEAEATPEPAAPAVDPVQVEQLSRTLEQAKAEAGPIGVPSVHQ
ncbi:cutinase precursor [Venturia nashicola]|uniref:Cutinase n=1 Tax=Venturia nashicola TaxID=86259 RepID=A0A4Z1PSH0_9PEZI|nr:cutinase precursor [Venturia nashicola]TLD38132.1 cutinase precursor [Venturia nashicola]